MKEFREWINLALTIVGVFGVGYLNLKFANQKLEIQKEAKEEFATKQEVGKIIDSDTAQWKAIQDTRDSVRDFRQAYDLKMQHLQDVVLKETNNHK